MRTIIGGHEISDTRPPPHLACPISEERARVRRCGCVYVVSRDVWRDPKDRADLVDQLLAVPGTERIDKATPASVVLIGRGSGP